MERELRRRRSDLRILGSGVIAFNLWTLIKPFLLVLLAPQALDQSTEAPAALPFALPTGNWLIVLSVLILIALPMDVVLRFYIGFAARAEGRGKHKGMAYVVMALIICALQVLGMLLTLYQLVMTGILTEDIMSTVAAALLELSAMVIMGELAYTALKVKKLTKQKAG